jgi:hypothetical protein
MLPFGLLLGMAASMKPTAAPLGIALLALAWLELQRQKSSIASYIGFSLAGFAAAALVIVHFFWRYHAAADFVEISRRLLPFYAGVSNHSISWLIANLAPRHAFYPLLAATLILTIRGLDRKNWDWRNWEWQVLAVTICFGALSFIVQRKGFLYHRYPLTAFLLLWMALEFCRAMKAQDWTRWVGMAGVAGLLLLVPGYCRSIVRSQPKALLADSLVDDLKQLGGVRLQNQVQCMDMVSGCVQALFRLGLVQNMGYMGDYMFFALPGSQPSPYYRDRFLEQARRSPPGVIVVTTAWMTGPDSFDKVNQWPEFVALLERDYTLVTTRICDPANSRGYKIYQLRPQ